MIGENKSTGIRNLMEDFAKNKFGSTLQDGHCRVCGEYVELADMGVTEIREYNISGMCTSCQDRIFG